ncbi:MAG TPA: hypothetical protein VFW03_25085, partial [Gemmatimonadaceae bacterium]|nr:hypothetical protein [Gemmatimonadaceae bacterium]
IDGDIVAVPTTMVASPRLPSDVAVIVADPSATPVATPFAAIVTIAVLLLDHVTLRPDSALPAASATVAVSGVVSPGAMVTRFGTTVTVATDGAAATGAPSLPPQAATAAINPSLTIVWKVWVAW